MDKSVFAPIPTANAQGQSGPGRASARLFNSVLVLCQATFALFNTSSTASANAAASKDGRKCAERFRSSRLARSASGPGVGR